MNEAQKQTFAPFLITVLGTVCYGFMLWAVVPADLSAARYWQAFLFTTKAGQIGGLALATCIYAAGLGLCLIGFSSWLPIRSQLLRRLLSISGVLVGVFGALLVWGVLVCFIDKVR